MKQKPDDIGTFTGWAEDSYGILRATFAIGANKSGPSRKLQYPTIWLIHTNAAPCLSSSQKDQLKRALDSYPLPIAA